MSAHTARVLPLISMLALALLASAVEAQPAGGPSPGGGAQPAQTGAPQPRAAQSASATGTHARPRIGLALSGGGARGGAHIGVLRALRDLGVPIDYIAGTSMGAVIGSLYASGVGEDELDKIAGEIDWSTILLETPDRDDRSFHRKRDDELYLVKMKAGFNDGRVELPMGAIQGQKFDVILGKLLMPVSHVQDFDDLAVPFRAVAADVVTGDAVVLDHGSLAGAVRASMSLPAIIAPVEIDGRLLVDGGIAQNLPVDAVRAMGADIVIAIDISTPLAGRDQLTSIISIASQLTGLLTTRGTAAQIAKLSSRDVLITPELGDITTTGFDRMPETYKIGYDATMQVAEQLRALALSPEAYAAYREARPMPRVETPPQIDFVRIANDSPVSNSIIETRLKDIPTGAPLDVAATEEAVAKVYGLELFQNVNYAVVEEDGRSGLEVQVHAKDWGPNYLQAGLKYSSVGDEDNKFGVSLSYLKTAMNSWGAEWRSTLGLGDEPSALTEWHQPYGRNAMYFATAGLSIETPVYNVFDNGNKVAQVRAHETGVEFAIGREFSNWGELRGGLARGSGDTKLQTGDPAFPVPDDYERGEFFTRFTVDTLDSLYFPTRGVKTKLDWKTSQDNLGASEDFDQLSFVVVGAKTFGRSTVFGITRFQTTGGGTAPVQDLFRVGGFLNLSGLENNELTGQNAGELALGYHRRLGHISRLPMYAGFTLEKGNVWDDRSAISLGNTIDARSIWVGADTPIGPLYLAYGKADGGRDAVYLYLGSVF